MSLSDEAKRDLTEFLGECWHEFNEFCPEICSKCRQGNNWNIIGNRTFDTWQDLGDCKDAIVNLNKDRKPWDDFIEFAIGKYFGEHIREGVAIKHSKFMRWLFRPTDDQGNPHFCRLVCESGAWKKGGSNE